MKRSTILILAINAYGITAAILTILGIVRTPIIIIPFILTPFIIDPFRKSRSVPESYLSIPIVGVLVIVIALILLLVLTGLA